MELKDGQFTVSGKDTAQGLLDAMREISLRLTEKNGNRFKDTGEPVIRGTGGYGAIGDGGNVGLWVATTFGCVLVQLEPVAVMDLVGKLLSAQAMALAAHKAQAEAAATKSSGGLN